MEAYRFVLLDWSEGVDEGCSATVVEFWLLGLLVPL